MLGQDSHIENVHLSAHIEVGVAAPVKGRAIAVEPAGGKVREFSKIDDVVIV